MLDITDDDVYTAIGAFLSVMLPGGTPVIRGQQNRVPMPNVPCVVMTTLGAPRRIGTNKDTVEAVVTNGKLSGFTAAVEADFEYSVQLDFYSPNAATWAMTAELLWRDKMVWATMPAGIKPLYSEGRQQLPLIGGENQWIQRWTMTVVLDYQPTWTQPTQAALVAEVVLKPIDVFFPVIWTSDRDINSDSDAPA